MKKILTCLILLLMLPWTVLADDTKVIKGKYTYYVDEKDNITFAEARNNAIEYARREGLKEVFGAYLSSDVVTHMKVSADGSTHNTLWDLSQETVKGEWLGDIDAPSVDISYDKATHTFAYTVEIHGKGKELVGNKTPIEWHVLCDGTDAKNASEVFPSKSRLYVDFKSPVSGYVAIYLLSEDEEANCLLPYRSSETGIYEVKAGKRYVFFDKDADAQADRYSLSTNKELENNVIYLIFSPNSFTKCNDVSTDPNRPSQLKVKDFEKWRMGMMQKDSKMVAERRWIKIKGD